MSKLARLLEAKEPLFSLALRDLEKITGQKSIDVLLLTEIMHKLHNRMRRLDLDIADTAPKELHRALENRLVRDIDRLTRMVGGKDDGDVAHLVPLIIKAAEKVDINRKCWALKRSVAKDLLREKPPQKMMEHLGYRSIDSMLKREPFDEMYSALRFSEGSDWLDDYNKLFSKVKPSDFEERDISIIEMDQKKWQDLTKEFVKKKRHNVTHTKELGTIVIVPMHQKKKRGLVLVTLPLIFHYINEIRLYSSYFKFRSTHKDFGALVVDTITAEPSKAAIIAGQHVHWRVIQKYFGKLNAEDHPEQFEPHVHPEDLHWRKAEEVLFEMDMDMEFWRDLDYVAMDVKNDRPVALNLLDVAFAYSNEESFDNRYIYHFREALWNEIFMRYMGERVLEEQILRQLDNENVKPEELK